ncbi:hypothetical protein AcV7_000682 [Taiwanofungus camphoratus]|nr:hypothetical protein AcW2_000838 [Antrodia cinnamomea]KAI0961628.1 hypothetical protein AcV7_000682 [Antrodia cinnamomea]
MYSSKASSPPLNYFQQSPVRGQLETPDGYSRTGWRYLQCTDTPNELRVLLPPRTALIYGQLLKTEAAELAKDRNASWDRILQIRHLKDRMIRKCQRLARAEAPQLLGKQAARSMFFTVHAPPDFRLKEMERWFRLQGAEFAYDVAEEPTARRYCCSKYGPPQSHSSQTARRGAPPHRLPPPPYTAPGRVPLRRMDSLSQTTTLLDPSPSPPKPQARLQSTREFKTAGRVPSVAREPEYHQKGRHTATDYRKPIPPVARIQARPARAQAASPDPLPIPFRARDPEKDVLAVTDSPSLLCEELLDSPTLPPASPIHEQPLLPPNGPTLPTIHEGPDAQDDDATRPVPRRRSSLKKSTSMSRLSMASQTKSVAWAMDRDWIEQMSQYMKAATEAEVLGHELEEIRAEYHEEINVMKDLCRHVTDASEKIRLEMEKLQRNEEAVRKQENKLLFSIDKLDKKESQFRDKGELYLLLDDGLTPRFL